ncbi:Fanconi anemia group J protein homolog [Procambarus clarkii]|uniref:Fanconi anemia group J protein homolog n=1 Tax=Procambarus clarkii TaxID=6728 RepID=UPI003743707E
MTAYPNIQYMAAYPNIQYMAAYPNIQYMAAYPKIQYMAVYPSIQYMAAYPSIQYMADKREDFLEESDGQNEQASGCRYYHGVNKIKTHDQLASYGMSPAWDIEDLVTLGKKIKACPYFAARSLMATAEVIICPYNYLIDPCIRESMEINLNDQVIVLDEAHNIEDSAREAASCTLTKDEIDEAISDFKRMIKYEAHIHECTELSVMLSALSDWVASQSDKLTDYKEFDRSGKIFKGTEMVAILENLDIGYNKYDMFKDCLAKLMEDVDLEHPDPENKFGARINSTTSTLLKNLFLMYHFMFMDNMKYRDDYRIALVKAQTRKKGSMTVGGWFGRGKSTVEWVYSINFWCLNPGVAFNSVGSSTRSIILTSGTLSPMNSFQSELSVPFKIQLEANHVVDKNQVWVGTVGRGPTDQLLQATYRHTETWEFQDELGRLVLAVCKAVPRGILCFLPSYAMLNKLVDRWQVTGIWNELNEVKVVITEPRNNEQFEEAITLFYDTIKNTGTENCEGINGAFFMAVCRGKVSEGLDFTDDNARAVIAVGIPYPNVKDIQVDLKRQYNNEHYRSRGLLTGGDWYEIQAYRAINQALGRCIRHRFDWGALILVDERYQRGSLSNGLQQNKYTRGLSKWVRNKIVHHQNFSEALSKLNEFAESMTAHPPVNPESLDETVPALKEMDISERPQTSPCASVDCSPRKLNWANKSCNQSPRQLESSLTHTNRLLANHAGASIFSVPSNINEINIASKDKSINNKNIALQDSTDPCIGANFSSNMFNDPETQLFEDFMDKEDLILPSGRLPFTSTQLLDSRKTVSSQASDFVSALTLTKLDNSNPSKRRKSSSLGDKIKTNKKKGKSLMDSETPKTFTDGGYKFQYIDASAKCSVSPLKMLIENEIKEKSPLNSGILNSDNKKNQSNAVNISSAKKSLLFGTTQCGDKVDDEASVNHQKTYSPQLFDSEDDQHVMSPLKPLLNVVEATIHDKDLSFMQDKHSPASKMRTKDFNSPGNLGYKSKPDGNVTLTTSQTSTEISKENSGLCKTRKRPLLSPNISNFWSSGILDDDSDLEDFNLNKSFNRREARKSSTKTAARTKGVQFSEFDE